MEIVNELKLDMLNRSMPPVVNAVQDDSMTRKLKIEFYEGATVWNPHGFDTISVAFRKPDDKRGWYDLLPDGTPAVVSVVEPPPFDRFVEATVTLAPEVLTTVGKVDVTIIFQDKRLNQIATFPFIVDVAENPANNQTISNDYYNVKNLAEINAELDRINEILESSTPGSGVKPEYVNNNFANVIKETLTGATVSTDKVSPITHDVECKVSGVDDPTAVTVTQNPGGKTFKPNAEGVVTGMKSISPSMTILTDNSGANLEVTYNVDTKKYVEDNQTGFDIVDSLPVANEENYKKAKLYLNGGSLSYVVKEVSNKPEIKKLESKLPNPKYGMCSAQVGEKLYLFDGIEIIKFDCRTKTVTQIPEKLPSSRDASFGVPVDDKIYILGGTGTQILDDIVIFDVKSEKSTLSNAKMPFATRNFCATNYGDYIYIFGGERASGNTRDILRFNIKTNEFITLDVKLPGERTRPGIATSGKYAYIFGGYGRNGLLSSILKFDLTSEKISTISEELTIPRDSLGLALIDKDIFIIGGNPASKTQQLLLFDTKTEKISIVGTSLPVGLGYESVAVLGERFWTVGGLKPSGSTKDIYEYSFEPKYLYKSLATTAQTTELTNAVLSQGGNV